MSFLQRKSLPLLSLNFIINLIYKDIYEVIPLRLSSCILEDFFLNINETIVSILFFVFVFWGVFLGGFKRLDDQMAQTAGVAKYTDCISAEE